MPPRSSAAAEETTIGKNAWMSTADGSRVLVGTEVAGEVGDADRGGSGVGVRTRHRVGDQVVVPRPQELEDARREHRHRQRQLSCTKILTCPAPSMRAASNRSRGSPRCSCAGGEDRGRHGEPGVGEPHGRRGAADAEVGDQRDGLVDERQGESGHRCCRAATAGSTPPAADRHQRDRGDEQRLATRKSIQAKA